MALKCGFLIIGECEDSCLLVRNAVQFGTKVSEERFASIRILP